MGGVMTWGSDALVDFADEDDAVIQRHVQRPKRCSPNRKTLRGIRMQKLISPRNQNSDSGETSGRTCSSEQPLPLRTPLSHFRHTLQQLFPPIQHRNEIWTQPIVVSTSFFLPPPPQQTKSGVGWGGGRHGGLRMTASGPVPRSTPTAT
eukprot:1834961-Rhodomonas_salina.1